MFSITAVFDPFFIGNSIYSSESKDYSGSIAEAFMSVSRTDWACLGIIILGILLFLIGANVYNAYVGWFGVFLFVGGALFWIARYVYGMLVKRQVQKP